jgi:hypothetical protein
MKEEQNLNKLQNPKLDIFGVMCSSSVYPRKSFYKAIKELLDNGKSRMIIKGYKINKDRNFEITSVDIQSFDIVS